MHLSLLSVLAATAAALPAAEENVVRRAAPLVAVPSGFAVVPPSVALSALSAKAEATPSAVKLVPGVPLKIDANGPQDAPPKAGPLLTDKPHPPVSNPARKLRKDKRAGTCTSPSTVYEWSSTSVTSAQRASFVTANKCLTTTAARSGLSGTVNRWDDLAALHSQLMPTIHNVGQFLPWHRYFLWIYEQELRNTCGYTGPMLWWDETKYAGRFAQAPHFTSSYFGTLSLNTARCVTNGAFYGVTLHIGPGTGNSNHCLSRRGSESDSSQVTSNYVSTCNSYTSFDSMQSCSGGGPHAYGHNAVGSVMGDVYASPQAPEFFLHHHFINRNWRVWQGVSPSTRTYAIGGSTTQNCGSNCKPTTLQYVLQSKGFYPNVTLDQVMDTQGGFLCYVYDY